MVTPLTDLTEGGAVWEWTEKCQKAYESIKHALCNAPTLAMPDYTKFFVFEVITDASLDGIGAVLTQDGRPIPYESRK